MTNTYNVFATTPYGLAMYDKRGNYKPRKPVELAIDFALAIARGKADLTYPASLESAVKVIVAIESLLYSRDLMISQKEKKALFEAKSSIFDYMKELEPDNVLMATIANGRIFVCSNFARSNDDVMLPHEVIEAIEDGENEIDIFYSEHYISRLLDLAVLRIKKLEEIAIAAKGNCKIEKALRAIENISGMISELMKARIDLRRTIKRLLSTTDSFRRY